ncbi:hypothetical protein BDV23DRAFT_163915 [Aspergillus alliaceus]|uniref:Uncharacterized protein n=1 Tax=Petromyces alliaceus TaxID=209559 RepID=A0A5N7BWS1_PETAA|nr:hypothetical protein BDV23DRAFT_163915 [Aspergillus alliaceus]
MIYVDVSPNTNILSMLHRFLQPGISFFFFYFNCSSRNNAPFRYNSWQTSLLATVVVDARLSTRAQGNMGLPKFEDVSVPAWKPNDLCTPGFCSKSTTEQDWPICMDSLVPGEFTVPWTPFPALFNSMSDLRFALWDIWQ